jgi:magnesium-transporting ATPase (P-type)
MAQLGRMLIWVIGLCALTFFIGVLRGQNWVEMFMATVALVVAAIPEGLLRRTDNRWRLE